MVIEEAKLRFPKRIVTRFVPLIKARVRPVSNFRTVSSGGLASFDEFLLLSIVGFTVITFFFCNNFFDYKRGTVYSRSSLYKYFSLCTHAHEGSVFYFCYEKYLLLHEISDT